MLSITTANHILTTAVCYRVARVPIGYWPQPPPIDHYRSTPPCPEGQLPKIIMWFRDISYLHQHTNSRGHREYKLTFRRITLILCYQVVTYSGSCIKLIYISWKKYMDHSLNTFSRKRVILISLQLVLLLLHFCFWLTFHYDSTIWLKEISNGLCDHHLAAHYSSA